MGITLVGAAYLSALEGIKELLNRVPVAKVWCKSRKIGSNEIFVFRLTYHGKDLTATVRIEFNELKNPILKVEGAFSKEFRFNALYNNRGIEDNCKAVGPDASPDKYIALYNEVLKKLREIIKIKETEKDAKGAEIWDRLFSDYL